MMVRTSQANFIAKWNSGYLIKKISWTIASLLWLLFISPSSAYIILPPACQAQNEDNCLQNHNLDYIFIYQTISSDEYRFFKKLDEIWKDNIPLPPIFLESGGGDTWNAFYVGRILRKRHATVYTGSPISKLDRAECASACVYIAAGAERRFLSGIGLHHGIYVEEHGRLAPTYSSLDSEMDDQVKEYLTEMGIDGSLNKLILATPSSNVHLIYHVPDFPLEGQLIHKLGFRMDPSEDEKKFIFSRYVRDETADNPVKIKFAAYNGSFAAIRDLIKFSVSIADGKEPDFISAQYWAEYGVSLGDLYTVHNYAVALANGQYGHIDMTRAIQLYRSAAQRGLGPSQNNLGWAYYTGKGIERNIPLAVFWITQAALQDNNFAYGSLCEMHGARDVFPRDDLEAFKWCYLAISYMPPGNARRSSEEIMTILTSRMTDRQIDKAAERVSEWVPFRTGSAMKNVEDW